MTNDELISVSREQFSELLDKGISIACLVLQNDEHGLTLAAIDYVWENGNAVLISTRKPGTTGAPAHLQALGPSVQPLLVGDGCLYRRLRNEVLIARIRPKDPVTAQRIAAARREFLPALFGS